MSLSTLRPHGLLFLSPTLPFCVALIHVKGVPVLGSFHELFPLLRSFPPQISPYQILPLYLSLENAISVHTSNCRPTQPSIHLFYLIFHLICQFLNITYLLTMCLLVKSGAHTYTPLTQSFMKAVIGLS